MCLQCIAKSEIVVKDIIPGYSLHRSTVDVPDEWPLGFFGVVKMNDPLFVFPAILATDNEKSLQESAAKMIDGFGFTVDQGYDFVTACVAAGYDGTKSAIEWFFMHSFNRMYKTETQKITVSPALANSVLQLVISHLVSAIPKEFKFKDSFTTQSTAEIQQYQNVVSVTGPTCDSNMVLDLVSDDFFIPDINKVVEIPSLLDVYCEEAVQLLSKQIHRKVMLASGANIRTNAVGLVKFFQQNQPDTDNPYRIFAESNNFGLTVDIHFDPHSLRQRIFVDILFGITWMS